MLAFFWGKARRELYRLEYGTQPEGQAPSDKTFGGGENEFDAFVSGTGGGKHVPSAAFVDLVLIVVEGLRTGMSKQLCTLRSRPPEKRTQPSFPARTFFHRRKTVDRVLDRTRNRVYRTFMERLNSLGLL